LKNESVRVFMEIGKVQLEFRMAGVPGEARSGSMMMEEEIHEGESLRSLLNRLGGRLPQVSGPLFDPETQTLSSEVAVVINDHLHHLSQGLETKLKNGDRILIFPYLAGG
jgi:molybdopterin converting factor small subunit